MSCPSLSTMKIWAKSNFRPLPSYFPFLWTATLNHFPLLIDACAARNRPCEKLLHFPVPPVTTRKKAHGDNCLSYPRWRFFGSPFVLLFLRTNKPIRIDFLSIFSEDFRGPRKTVFLKIAHSKSAGNMARCGPNLKTSKVLFSFLTRINYCFGL